jgi:hypothetical protein
MSQLEQLIIKKRYWPIETGWKHVRLSDIASVVAQTTINVARIVRDIASKQII